MQLAYRSVDMRYKEQRKWRVRFLEPWHNNKAVSDLQGQSLVHLLRLEIISKIQHLNQCFKNQTSDTSNWTYQGSIQTTSTTKLVQSGSVASENVFSTPWEKSLEREWKPRVRMKMLHQTYQKNEDVAPGFHCITIGLKTLKFRGQTNQAEAKKSASERLWEGQVPQCSQNAKHRPLPWWKLTRNNFFG